MTTRVTYDFSAINARVPIAAVLERFSAVGDSRALEGRTKFGPCPQCGKKNCQVHVEGRGAKGKGNSVKCWSAGCREYYSPIDWVMAVEAISEPADAAARLCDEFPEYTAGCMQESEGPPRAPVELTDPQRHWQRLVPRTASDGLPGEAREFLTARGLPDKLVRQLARLRLVSFDERLGHGFPRGVNPPALTFPAWRLDHLDDLGDFRDPAPEAVRALWHRVLDPPDLGGDDDPRKANKDRSEGPIGGCWYTACTRRELQQSSVVVICEGFVKGLAVHTAIRGLDVQAELDAAQGEAHDGDRKRLTAKLTAIRSRFRGWTWLAASGTSSLSPERVVAAMRVLVGRRYHPPLVLLAPDNDDAGRRAALDAYRSLIPAGFNADPVYPTCDSGDKQDWDGLLQQDGGCADRLRDDLTDSPFRGNDDDMILRVGGRRHGRARFMRKGTLLQAKVMVKRKVDGDEIEVPEWKDVAEFVSRGVTRYRIYKWSGAGGPPWMEIVAVHYTPLAGKGANRLMKTAFFDQKQFNNPRSAAWGEVGQFYNESLARFYLTNMREQTFSDDDVIPVVGVSRHPTEKGKWRLFDGPERRRIDPAVGGEGHACVYDDVDWSSEEFGGTTDAAQARADGRDLLAQLRAMFARPVGSLLAYWILGTVLKSVTWTYPHFEIVAHPETGKSTLADILVASFRLKNIDNQQFRTAYRRKLTLCNHTLPVIGDEISRIGRDAIEALADVLNGCFNVGKESTHGPGGKYSFFMCGSLLGMGQDGLREPALESKQIAVRLTHEDRDGGVKPDVARIPRWPWRSWAEWVVDRLETQGEDAVRDLLGYWSAWIESRLEAVGRGATRFCEVWSRVLTARQLVREFLALPADDEADRHELDHFVAIARAQARTVLRSGKESVSILRRYAAVLAADHAGEHPFRVVETYTGGQLDRANSGVWINVRAILPTLERHGYRNSAIHHEDQLRSALRHDGLFGAPPPDDEADPAEWESWIGGHWRDVSDGHGGVRWEPDSRKFRIPVRRGGGRVKKRANLYLLPKRVLEEYDIDFPQEIEDDGDDDTGGGGGGGGGGMYGNRFPGGAGRTQ